MDNGKPSYTTVAAVLLVVQFGVAWTMPHMGRDMPETPLISFHFSLGVLIALIALHALAALYHRFIRRDSVLQRMLPSVRVTSS